MCTCVCKTGECNKDAFHDELNVLTTKIRSQQKVTVGIDANGNMGLEQQSDVPRKGYYPTGRISDNINRVVDLCEQKGLIV
ncbi:hypothetical protein RB195_000945 [Necator americanus]|uniref:Uncharacterized protein n=1 Tax=Necator americanus TaxID=51031 RepID=A0ABR1DDP3_NECAM